VVDQPPRASRVSVAVVAERDRWRHRDGCSLRRQLRRLLLGLFFVVGVMNLLWVAPGA